MATEPFYAQKRLKAAKRAIRENLELEHSDGCDQALLGFLEDLAKSLAARHPVDEEGAFFYALRCMGTLVQWHAKDAYEPYGYADPFAPPPAPPEPAAPLWKWPVVATVPSDQPDGLHIDFREFSALKMFGYTVGKTNGWPRARRRAFLSDFMEQELPPKVRDLFGDAYGDPLSADRLRQVATVIASNASLRWRHDPERYRVAIADWEDDLGFLKAEFYERRGLKFVPWPSSRTR